LRVDQIFSLIGVAVVSLLHIRLGNGGLTSATQTHLSVRLQLSHPLSLFAVSRSHRPMIRLQPIKLCTLLLDLVLDLLLVLAEILHDRSQLFVRFCKRRGIS
jgi:hypothetical protein